jgi:hypothetical protein
MTVPGISTKSGPKYLVEGASEKIQHFAIRCVLVNFIPIKKMKGLKTLTIAIDGTNYRKWTGDEYWGLCQQVD